MVHTIFGHFDIDIDFGFLFRKHISFITNNLPQISLNLDEFLFGHSSRYCDSSCLSKTSRGNVLNTLSHSDC